MADKPTIHCTVAVPNRQLFDGEVYYASIPGVEGQFGVLPGHELILSLTKEGGLCTLYLDEAHTEKKEILLFDGIAQVAEDKLTVLGRLGKLCERIHCEEMRERASAQEKIVEELSAMHKDDDKHVKAQLEQEKLRLKWYNIQVDWANKYNK